MIKDVVSKYQEYYELISKQLVEDEKKLNSKNCIRMIQFIEVFMKKNSSISNSSSRFKVNLSNDEKNNINKEYTNVNIAMNHYKYNGKKRLNVFEQFVVGNIVNPGNIGTKNTNINSNSNTAIIDPEKNLEILLEIESLDLKTSFPKGFASFIQNIIYLIKAMKNISDNNSDFKNEYSNVNSSNCLLNISNSSTNNTPEENYIESLFLNKYLFLYNKAESIIESTKQELKEIQIKKVDLQKQLQEKIIDDKSISKIGK